MSACEIQRIAPRICSLIIPGRPEDQKFGHHPCWQVHWPTMPSCQSHFYLRKKGTRKQIKEGGERGRERKLKKDKTQYHIFCLCLSLCMCTECASAQGEQTRTPDPRHRKHRKLEAPVWLLGVKLRSFNQEQQALYKLLSPLCSPVLFFQITLMYESVGTGEPQCMWPSEDNFRKKFLLSFNHVQPRAPPQVGRNGSRHIYHLSCLSGFQCYSFSLL